MLSVAAMESEMKEDLTKYSPSDPKLIDTIVNTIKSKGIFDQFRKDCLADVDTKVSCITIIILQKASSTRSKWSEEYFRL